MRVKRLWVDEFKNLRDFEIAFDASFYTSVIVGQNGTGKSNILEALVSIFRDLHLKELPNFSFELDYSTRRDPHEYDIAIKYDKTTSSQEKMNINVTRKRTDGALLEGMLISSDTKDYTYNGFLKARDEFLPQFVFGYYSGPSSRMEHYFEQHQDNFADSLLRGDDKPLRPLLYARNLHSQFVLMAFFQGQEKDENISEFLREKLRIVGFDSVLFILHKPYWAKKETPTTTSNLWSTNGDPRFWGARGVVQQFLGRLFDLAYPPLHMYKIRTRQSFFKKFASTDLKYLYLPDLDSLNQLAAGYDTPQEFFKALESLLISDLIERVLVRVIVEKVDGSLSFYELSEGEQQLLTVLGLLRFTQEEESLLLLDEPDTHLNPAWSMEYIGMLNKVVGDQQSSQIIMTTHDPIVLANLRREQVRILSFEVDGDRIQVDIPEGDPNKMGYPEILTSDIFRLRSIINPTILALLDEKRQLAIKEDLSANEKRRLKHLNLELQEFDFTTNVRDTLYKPFVKAMTQIEQEEGLDVPVLTEEQRERRLEFARRILKNLQDEESS